MILQAIKNKYQVSDKTNQILEQLLKPNNHFQVSNLVGSSLSFLMSEVFKKLETPFLLLCNDKEEAAYFLNDFERLLGDKNVLFFPSSFRRPYQIEETDNANVLLRSEVLNRINSRKKPALIVSYTEALFEKVITKKELENYTLKVRVGEHLSLDFVNEALFEYKFKRVDFVTEPGEFSVRGGIIDVFSFANEEPFRIEFFGDEIDSIRTFDVETQLSKERLTKVFILPNIENKSLQEPGLNEVKIRESFLEYISKDTKLFVKNTELLFGKLDQLFEKAENAFKELSKELKHSKPDELFCSSNFIKSSLEKFTLVHINQNSNIGLEKINFEIQPQPSFNKKFPLLIKNLIASHQKGFTNYFFCANEKQAQRFHDIFESEIAENQNNNDQKVHYQTIVFPIYQGFVDNNHKIVCYTDHQVFERYQKFSIKNGYAKKQAITLKELNTLQVGDFVTHIDHGIGKFGGLQKIDIDGNKQEAIKLIYGDRDILYVSIHSLHKISKYNGKDGKAPKIFKLGSAAWKKIKQKTKSRVKQIAFDLIQLYAKRKMQKGFAFGPDTYMQHELEASFLFEDTPDQITATEDVKKDMESIQPMDRLICGDVGFGKTEIAIRAAFKAVDNNKQVAILVPTTILAFQHFKTFSSRLEEFPIKIEYLNRFRTTKERNEIIEGVNNGSVDIVIGTHQLTNQKIKFKDLGLLVIDEEQKFGVAIKDKLKTIKENVDTLTLTATPIPRTLQFSLMAARDLSVITTPPPNRHPLETNVIRLDQEQIRDAISYEISRGGQVFFVHNRIENIKEVAGMLQRLVPDAKIGIGHGQMEGKKLEGLMFRFMNNEFDVLVSTTIIESGLDVSNANTIFINNANNFGLSDLHQMRGRVGRSNKKAFCYFITPPYHMMTDEARKRIQALEIFSDLGSGIQIAMKDLEIRGAGDLLGGEQSGFINDIGFETYQKILNEAIIELKENEFKDLYLTSKNDSKNYVKEVQIDTDFEILFPDNYVNSITERLNLYNQLASFENEEQLLKFEDELIDRFGKLPKPVIDLLDSVRLKWFAKNLGLEKLILKQKRLIGYFVSNQQSNYYQTETFSRFLQYVQTNSKSCVIKEKDTKNGLRLLITFIKIDSVKTALETLKNI